MVLKLNRKDLPLAYEKAPILKRIFAQFYRTYRLLCKLDLPWRQPQETVYLLTRRTRFILWMRILPLLSLSLAVFGLLLYWAMTVKNGGVALLVLAVLALGTGISSRSGRRWSGAMIISSLPATAC
jgi:hypothetical protein